MHLVSRGEGVFLGDSGFLVFWFWFSGSGFLAFWFWFLPRAILVFTSECVGDFHRKNTQKTSRGLARRSLYRWMISRYAKDFMREVYFWKHTTNIATGAIFLEPGGATGHLGT